MDKQRKEYMKTYRLKNKEKLKAKTKEWRNSEAGKRSLEKSKLNGNRKASLRKYRTSTNGKESQKRYQLSPKGKMCNKVRNNHRYLRIKDLKLPTVQLVYEDNIKQYGTLTCYLCLEAIEFGNDHLEHKTPLVRGGSNDYENLKVSCSECNLKKGTKTLREYLNAKATNIMP